MSPFREPSAQSGGAAGGAAGFLRVAHSPARIAAWRSAYLHGILIALAFLPFDFLYRARLPATLGIRAGLVAILVACRWGLAVAPRNRTGPLVLAGATAAALLVPALVVVSASGDGARFGFLLTVPFLLLVLLEDVPQIGALATLAGVVAAAAGGAVLSAEGRPVRQVLEWTLLATIVTGVTVVGARRVCCAANRADDAERERREALTCLEESERRRASSERLALLGRLAAGIGHEINNPLAAVKGNVACALEELSRAGVAAHTREALDEALDACDRIAWITADMRALVAEASAPLGPCEVGAAIRDAVERAAVRLGDVRLVTTLEPGLPSARSEPRLLADTIAQLASQAGRMAARGREARGAPPTVRISARRIAGEIEIAVDHDGPRIPAHVLPRLFEPFTSLGEFRGAGIGLTLPLTRELAERSGGRVAAAWRDGGNRFTVTLAVAGD